MRFAPSWDDSVFAPVAAVVAAITAMFSGHMIYRKAPSPPPVAYHAPLPVDVVPGGDDTDSGADPARLCDQVLTKEADVDALNDQLDVLLRDVKAHKAQRLK